MTLRNEFRYYLHNVMNMLLYIVPMFNLFSSCKKIIGRSCFDQKHFHILI